MDGRRGTPQAGLLPPIFAMARRAITAIAGPVRSAAPFLGVLLMVQTIAALAAAARADELPEFYGLYILEKGKAPQELTDTDQIDRLDVGGDVELLLFDADAKTKYQDIHLARMKYVRRRIDYRGGYRNEEPSVEEVNRWDLVLSSEPDSTLIDLRFAPVPNQQEMVRIIPEHPLTPGAYVVFSTNLFRLFAYPFTVDSKNIDRDADCVDIIIGAPGNSALDDFAATFIESGRPIACSESAIPKAADLASCQKGWNAQKAGQYDQAIDFYTECIRISKSASTLTAAYLNRSQCYEAICDLPKALEDLDRAIAVQPTNAQAYNAKGWLLSTAPDPRVRNGEEAVAAALKALQLQSDDAMIRDTLAAAYAEAGQFDKAVAEQSLAIEQLPQEQRAAYLGAMTARLELYKRHRPYRSAKCASPPAENEATLSPGAGNAAWFVENGVLGQFKFGTLVRSDGPGKVELAERQADANRIHAGVDIAAPRESKIYSPVDGKVIDVINSEDDSDKNQLGYAVIIQLNEKILGKTHYALFLHMNAPPRVGINSDVTKGVTLLGEVGDSGSAQGTHVHVEIRDFESRYLEDPEWRSPRNIYGVYTAQAMTLLHSHWIDPELYFSN